MNRDNIQKLIGVLENLKPGEMDMSYWWGGRARTALEDGIQCHMPACIGGWCVRLISDELAEQGMSIEDRIDHFADSQDVVREFLGLENGICSSLTYPGPIAGSGRWNNKEGIACDHKVTPYMAIMALRNILDGCDAYHVWDGTKAFIDAPQESAVELTKPVKIRKGGILR